MALLMALVANAEPANPTPVTIQQPNGESLQLMLVGDEYYHFNTTVDGYTIVKSNGRWEYATLMNEKLTSTGVMAHDPQARSSKEITMLSTMPKRMVDKASVNNASKLRSVRDKKNNVGLKEAVVDYSKFRGLIILINYNDRQFGMSNANSFYNQLCNTENFSGFYHQGRFQQCTGSVRDYYYDNSMGQFDPDFDVIGPVNLDYSCYEGDEKSREIFQSALDAVDNEVDFSQYDADNDGMIDMVFFMVAGYSSSYSGNNIGYLWPHMSYLYGFNGSYYYYLQYDGKYMGRYASSCELYGWEDWETNYGFTMPNAIGTICHEFGHVLGLPDLYDTDYSGSGGESINPGGWDVMAGGSHNNYGRTPVGYSLWERWELGFTNKPTELTPGSKTLQAVNISNNGYMMSSPNPEEYFLFENRQPNKWDAALPGHGLLVTRVDRSDEEIWWQNEVNCNPNRNYYELLRASGSGDEQVPFPGNSNVTELTSITEPALITWDGQSCAYRLSGISESGNNIYFNVVAETPPSNIIEDFEAMPVSNNAVDQLGNFATWTFQRAKVATDANANGTKGCSITSPGCITMNSDVAISSSKVSMNVVNTATATAKLMLSYSTDEGENWTDLDSEDIEGGSDTKISWRISINQPVRYRLSLTSGSKTKPLIIDDITITYNDSTAYNLRIAGQQVNGVNMGNLSQLEGVEGVVQYLPISNTLKLKDANINKSNSMGISCSIPQFTLNVNGTNTINSGQNGMNLGSESNKINGDGNLYVKSVHQMGLLAGKNFVIEGGVMLELEGYNFGIIGNDGSTLTMNGEGTTVKAIGLNSNTFANLNNLILNDGLGIISPVGAYFDSSLKTICYNNGNSVSGEWITISKNESIPGDVNGDGECTASDITALYNFILYNDSSKIVNGDQNGDNEITASDVTAVYNIILGL